MSLFLLLFPFSPSYLLLFFQLLLCFLQLLIFILQPLLLFPPALCSPSMLPPLCIYLQSYLLNKRIFSELVALIILYTLGNLPLAFVLRRFFSHCRCCCCSLWCYYMLSFFPFYSHADWFIEPRGVVAITLRIFP